LKNKFLDYESRVRLNKTVFYVVTAPYTLGEVNGQIAICFNEQQKKDLVRLNKTVFYVVTAPYTLGEVNGQIAICFNEQQKKDLKFPG